MSSSSSSSSAAASAAVAPSAGSGGAIGTKGSPSGKGKGKTKEKGTKEGEADVPPPETIDDLRTGSRMLCKWRDGKYHTAIVLDRQVRKKGSGGGGEGDGGEGEETKEGEEEVRFYVHYDEFNRRMDEWVGPERLKIDNEAIKKVITAEDILHLAEPGHDEHEGMDEASIRSHEKNTRVKNINRIEIGRHVMDTWYFSPYPREIWADGPVDVLYIHEFSLRFFRHRRELLRHARKYPHRHPPGDEIYRKDGVAVWELDGSKEKEWCQNLSYLAKLFLDHKTLFYDVDPFLFYVITEYDEFGYHPVGYFSKEKYSDSGYNLACILTLPCHQRKGYGRFIIQFSYELSKKEGKVGSPEKPLSDLGLLSYRSYWTWVLLGLLRELPDSKISVMQLAERTSITPEDIVGTLRYHGLIRFVNGQHVICADPRIIDEKFQKLNKKKGPLVDPAYLHWAPLPPPPHIRKDKWSIKSKLKGPHDDSM